MSLCILKLILCCVAFRAGAPPLAVSAEITWSPTDACPQLMGVWFFCQAFSEGCGFVMKGAVWICLQMQIFSPHSDILRNLIFFSGQKFSKPIKETTQGITLQAKSAMLPGFTAPEDIPCHSFLFQISSSLATYVAMLLLFSLPSWQMNKANAQWCFCGVVL